LYKRKLVRMMRTMLRRLKSRPVQFALAAVFISLLIPFPTLGSPRWRVWVTGPDGKPSRGALVRLLWQNYSAEGHSHEEDRRTNGDGFAEFAPHRTWAGLGQRAFFTAKSATAFVHASFGPSAYVFAMQDDWQADDVKNGYEYLWNGTPDVVESHLRVRK
jgi:hypothetical protein